jgi:hypothetical protein
MNEVSFFRIRAQHHSRLALDATNPRLKAAYEAIATDMMLKSVTADPNRDVVMVDGVVVDLTGVPLPGLRSAVHL